VDKTSISFALLNTYFKVQMKESVSYINVTVYVHLWKCSYTDTHWWMHALTQSYTFTEKTDKISI